MMMMRRAGLITLVVIALAAAIGKAAPVLMDVKASLAGVVLADGIVEVGAKVEDGQPLVFIQTVTQSRAVAATAPRDGTVREVLVKAGQRIQRGDIVVRIETQ